MVRTGIQRDRERINRLHSKLRSTDRERTTVNRGREEGASRLARATFGNRERDRERQRKRERDRDRDSERQRERQRQRQRQ